jgi:Ser-tRNA(Ala) deacylase AlaX
MIDTESLSYLLNGILTALTLLSGFLLKKYKPELDGAKVQITNLETNIKMAGSILNQIKSIIMKCKEASADGNISPEEALKIVNEITVIADSEEVTALLNM